MKPLTRLLIAVVIGTIFFFIAPASQHFAFKYTLAWIGFSATFLILSWYLIFKRNIEELKKVANEDDGSKNTVLVLIAISLVANLFLVLLMLYTGNKSELTIGLAGLVSLSLMLSWAMVHTIFTFHYAHMYYDNDIDLKDKPLSFPDDDAPDYLDFAYHSFCIGSTFQVSDVETKSKKIRRLTLLHSLLSFSLNTFVVALMINVLGGLVN